jgi:hypothetical protein
VARGHRQSSGYLKIRERVDDPIPDIVARDILEHLARHRSIADRP